MFMYFGVSRHQAALLDLVSISFIFFNAILIVIFKNYTTTLNSITASIALQFSIEIPVNLSFAIRYWTESNNLIVCGERVNEYVEIKSEDEITKSCDPNNFPEVSDIKFDNITMRYREGLKPALKNVYYHVQPGQKVGIIGRTGAGKSTILQAIFRIIEIDKGGKIIIGGVDIKDIGLH